MAILIKFEDRPHLHEDRRFDGLHSKIWNPASEIDRFVRPFPSRADRTARRSGKHRSPCGTYETMPSIPRSGDNPSRVRGVYYFLDDATSVWAHCTSVNSPLVAISAPRSARCAVRGTRDAVRGQGCGAGDVGLKDPTSGSKRPTPVLGGSAELWSRGAHIHTFESFRDPLLVPAVVAMPCLHSPMPRAAIKLKM
jgi:hypothetical protein